MDPLQCAAINTMFTLSMTLRELKLDVKDLTGARTILLL